MKEVILQVGLKCVIAEILRNVPNITNLIDNQHGSTKNHMKQVVPWAQV